MRWMEVSEEGHKKVVLNTLGKMSASKFLGISYIPFFFSLFGIFYAYMSLQVFSCLQRSCQPNAGKCACLTFRSEHSVIVVLSSKRELAFSICGTVQKICRMFTQKKSSKKSDCFSVTSKQDTLLIVFNIYIQYILYSKKGGRR